MFKSHSSEDEAANVTYNKAANYKIDENTILKGSKLTGDIIITCDLELSGDIVGSITSDGNSNIVIKGTCKGDIKTGEGIVNIEGALESGDINSGKDVMITGSFKGGKVRANNRIFVNGEFSGSMESSEIEIGPKAKCKGDIFYKDHISISKGAMIEAQVSKVQEELKLVKNVPKIEASAVIPPVNEVNKTKQI